METIIFKDLPFRPVNNQVIYIETSYDKDVNDFIVSHLGELRCAFERVGKQFFYLPMLTLDRAIEEKVLYTAPYLSRKVLGATPIKSSSLLNFVQSMSTANVGPSLILNGRHDSDRGVSIYDLLPLDAVGSPVNMLADYIVRMRHEAAFRYAAAPSCQCDFRTEGELDCAPVPTEYKRDDRRGLTSLPTEEFRETLKEKEQERRAERREKKKNFLDKILRPIRKEAAPLLSDEDDMICDACCGEEVAADIPSLKEIEDEKLSIEETTRILQELRDNVQRLRLEGVSLMAIHEFIDRQEPISRMVITPDYRILLPDYNNMEIEMGALPKAIYFLFLRYPEGIVCKHMPDYYTELLGIYRQLRPTTDEARLNLTVTKVVNPLGNALNENIARIRKAFVEKFDEHLACNYIITGERGQQYAVALDRELITWEE